MNEETTSGDEPRWRELDGPDVVAAALVALYRRRGDGRYDEAVTQTEHGRQAAGHAIAAGADDTAVAAAFLHDIGHLLVADGADRASDRHHELVGSRFLANWFDDDVTQLIRLHVPAKRYLCVVEPAYRAALSPASERSLLLQGGPMDADEVATFESDPWHRQAVELRRWDELAKDPDAPAPSLDELRRMIVDVLGRSMPD